MHIQPTTALCALSLLAARPAAEELTFEPAQGLSLTRTLVYSSEIALEDFSIEVDGEDLTPMLGELSFEVESVQTYVVTDEFVSVADGEIMELRRTFDELSGESEVLIDMAMASETVDTTASSELEGSTVVFTWDADAEEYSASADEDSTVDDDLLEGLEMQMDLSGFLPDGPVDEGDSWEVELQDLQGLFFPGGDLALLPDDEMEGVEGFDPEALTDMMRAYQKRAIDMLDEWVDGTVRGTYVGTRESDGLPEAIVELELDLSVDADISQMVGDLLDEVFSQMDMPVEIDMSVDLVRIEADTEGDGQLAWDPKGAHCRTLKLLAEYDFEVEIEISIEAEGESHEVAAQIAGSGLLETDVTVE